MKRKQENTEPEATPEVITDSKLVEILNAAELIPEPLLSLHEYASAKNIDHRHIHGMAAFTQVKSATFEQWETIFKDY